MLRLWCYLSLALLWGCATPTPPSGGPKDETPPGIVREKSTPNFQTGFRKQTISLTFDEWVQLDDAFNQVVISPPIGEFDLRIKGKTVQFFFNEQDTLRPEATYTINFGEAIKDLTEKNPADNLRFVFSTGDYLDSLRLKGRVVDAFTGLPVENALFMLYDNLTDSVVHKERPFYFGKTNKEGFFAIENIKYGDFKGFALKDADFDYQFSQKTEPVGFPDTLIRMQDTVVKNLTLQLFTEEAPVQVLDVDTSRYGLVKLVFNRSPQEVQAFPDNLDGNLIPDLERDTLRLWYHQPSGLEWRLFLRSDTLAFDTLLIQPKPGGKFPDLLPFGGATPKTVLSVLPGNPLKIRFNRPLTRADTALVSLFQDTFPAPVRPELGIDSVPNRELLVTHRWKEGSIYRLEILPGGMTDIYGNTNQDTIVRNIKTDLLKTYGNLKLTVAGLDSTMAYLIEITTKDGNVLESFLVKNQPGAERAFQHLKPAEYTVRIVTDWNGNGRWDTGNYAKKRQPEPVFRQVLEQLRANWDLEATVEFKN